MSEQNLYVVLGKNGACGDCLRYHRGARQKPGGTLERPLHQSEAAGAVGGG